MNENVEIEEKLTWFEHVDHAKSLGILIDEYLADYVRPENISGGALHLVLEDINLDDGCIQLCLEHSLKKEDWLGAEICKQLIRFEFESRYKILGATPDAL